MKPTDFRECIAHVYCMGRNDFLRVFGEAENEGQHLWNKYVQYEKNPAEFICNLDNGNMDLLFNEFRKHLDKMSDRAAGKPKPTVTEELITEVQDLIKRIKFIRFSISDLYGNMATVDKAWSALINMENVLEFLEQFQNKRK